MWVCCAGLSPIQRLIENAEGLAYELPSTRMYEARERRVRLGAADAPEKALVQQLLGDAAADILPQGLPLIPKLPTAPEHVPARE